MKVVVGRNSPFYSQKSCRYAGRRRFLVGRSEPRFLLSAGVASGQGEDSLVALFSAVGVGGSSSSGGRSVVLTASSIGGESSSFHSVVSKTGFRRFT